MKPSIPSASKPINKSINSKATTNNNTNKNIFTLVDSDSEEGEIKSNVLPFYRSYFSDCLYSKYNSDILLGHNDMVSTNYIANANITTTKKRKHLRKSYSFYYKENALEESKVYFMNNKFMELEEVSEKIEVEVEKKNKKVSGDIPLLSNSENKIENNNNSNSNSIKISFRKSHSTHLNYPLFTKSIYSTSNTDIFSKNKQIVKTNSTATIVMSDTMINTLCRINNAYIHGNRRHNVLVFSKEYFSGVKYRDFNWWNIENYLVEEENETNNNNDDVIGGLDLKEKSISKTKDTNDNYTVREYSISYKNKKVTLFIHSVNNYELSNGIDIIQRKLKVVRDNTIKIINHSSSKNNISGIINILMHNIESMKENKKYLMSNEILCEVGSAGEQREYVEMDFK